MRGSLKRVGENRWRLTYDLPAEQGKRRQKRVTLICTKRDAEKELAKRIEDVRGGYRGTNDTLGQFMRGWIDSRTVAEYTRRGWRNSLKYIEPALGALPLDSITPAQLQKFYAHLLQRGSIRAKQKHTPTERGLNPSSVEAVHSLLKTTLRDAHRMGLIPFNPAERVRAPHGKSKTPRFLTPTEAKDILDRLAGSHYGPRWWFFVFMAQITGLRLGELAGLERADFRLDESLLLLQRSIGLNGPKAPKNGKPRVIPLPPELLPIIEEHLPASGRLFPKIAESPTRASALLSAVLTRLGYPGVHAHTFRHTVGSILMTRNIHPKAIQQLLGHHDVSYTMRVYSHLMPGAFADTTTPLGDLVRDKSVTKGTIESVKTPKE